MFPQPIQTNEATKALYLQPKPTPTRHLLAFSSAQRDPIKYPNPSKYSIVLEDELKKVLSARLVTAEIPKTEYNVRCDNSCFNICETVDEVITDYQLCFPSGDYDICRLVDEMGKLIVDAGLTHIYTINVVDGKLCIEATGQFELKFKDTLSADRIVENATKTSREVVKYGKCSEFCSTSCQKGSARSLLGFNIANYMAVEDPDTSMWKLCSPNKVNLIGEKVVYIHISTDTSRFDHIESKSAGSNNAFHRVPLNCSQNGVVFYSNWFKSLDQFVCCTPLNRVRCFNIELRTEDGRLYNLSGLNWCMSVEIVTEV